MHIEPIQITLGLVGQTREIAALMYGGKIDSFVIGLNAHVSLHGATYSEFGEALLNAAGMLLPVTLGAIALCLYKATVESVGYHICYSMTSASLTGSIVPWVVVPVLSLFRPPPPEDDVTRFLKVTGFHPLLVSLGASLLAAGLIFLIHKKGVFRLLKQVLSTVATRDGLGRRRSLVGLAVGLLLLAAVLFYTTPTPSAVFCASFTAENVLDAAGREWGFSVDETRTYYVDLDMKAHGFITDLRIVRDNGELAYANCGERFAFTSVMELWEGKYTVSLTHLTDHESIKRYFESTGRQIDLSPDDIQYFNDVLSHSDGDYSAAFSIQVR